MIERIHAQARASGRTVVLSETEGTRVVEAAAPLSTVGPCRLLLLGPG